ASMHARQQAARKARAYPERWLTAILGGMPDNAGLWAAVHHGRVVSALLVGWSGKAATALLSAADPEARPLKAGNLLYLGVLEALALRGLHSVDLGGSRDLPALEMFKRSLGGTRVSRPFFRYRHPGLRLYQRLASPRRN
ncbi:MAG: GNAT family N-acetyltransferase, partial [Candidatus Eisenbacteria bacterium]|nr:GNAT family N-acetyltransferase [Candidatus Eisenbacteria bacterium]